MKELAVVYERVGSCNRFCGRCCNLAHWRSHPLYESHAKAVLEAAPFIGENEHGECLHLKWEQGKATCLIYEDRPEVCRSFPNHPLSIVTIPECSYGLAESPRSVRNVEPILGVQNHAVSEIEQGA